MVARRWIVVWAIALAACGRVDFDVLTADATADASGDAASPPQTWNLVQTAGISVSPTLAIAATGSDHLIVVALRSGGTTISSVTDDAPGGSNVYVSIPAARAVNAVANALVELWYATGSRPGATTISVVSDGSLNTMVWEVDHIAAGNPVDTASELSDQPTTLTPFGPTITTTMAGEFVIAAAIVEINVIDIHAGNEFVEEFPEATSPGNDGYAHLGDPNAPAGAYRAEWDVDMSGTYCATGAAFFVGP